MALALKKRPLGKSSPSGGSGKPVELTIEEAREKYEIGTIERALAELRWLYGLKETAREAANATNRAKTVAGKVMASLVLNETLARGDRILIGDTAYFYDYSQTETYDFDALLKLYEKGEISRETFTKVCTVSKDKATKLIGAVVLEDLLKVKIGDKLDIRTEDLDKPIAEPYRIERKAPPKPKLQKGQQQPVPVSTGISQRPVRRIRVGR